MINKTTKTITTLSHLTNCWPFSYTLIKSHLPPSASPIFTQLHPPSPALIHLHTASSTFTRPHPPSSTFSIFSFFSHSPDHNTTSKVLSVSSRIMWRCTVTWFYNNSALYLLSGYFSNSWGCYFLAVVSFFVSRLASFLRLPTTLCSLFSHSSSSYIHF